MYRLLNISLSFRNAQLSSLIDCLERLPALVISHPLQHCAVRTALWNKLVSFPEFPLGPVTCAVFGCLAPWITINSMVSQLQTLWRHFYVLFLKMVVWFTNMASLILLLVIKPHPVFTSNQFIAQWWYWCMVNIWPWSDVFCFFWIFLPHKHDLFFLFLCLVILFSFPPCLSSHSDYWHLLCIVIKCSIRCVIVPH